MRTRWWLLWLGLSVPSGPAHPAHSPQVLLGSWASQPYLAAGSFSQLPTSKGKHNLIFKKKKNLFGGPSLRKKHSVRTL